MLIQITVRAKDLKDVNKLLDHNVVEKPTHELCFELTQSSLRIVPNPVNVLVTYEQWVILSDYEEEHNLKR